MARAVPRREFLRGAAALGAGWALLPRLTRAEPSPAGQWLAGDLHCHTVYSHDVWSPLGDDNTGPEQAYTLGWTAAEQIAIAEARGLDFLAVTDHDDVRWLHDGTFEGYRGPVVLVPGYEHSLRRGHAGCLGVFHTFQVDTGDDAGAEALARAVRAEGGLFVLNHPFYKNHPPTGAEGTPAWGYSTTAVVPDSVEVWNIGWPFRRPLFQGASTSENYLSVPWWDREFLGRGRRVPATGGSDNHWRSTTAVQGVGQPTTWVYAAERTWPAVLDGIRAGRTFVAAEPPSLGGPRLFLTAERGPDRFMVGDVVPAAAGEVTVVAEVEGGAAGFLQFVVDGAPSPPVPVGPPGGRVAISVRADLVRRVRAELYLDPGWWMWALTSPIYFG